MMDLPEESPALKLGEEKEIGMEGLRKKLVKKGDVRSWRRSRSAHYSGTLLDGSKFGSRLPAVIRGRHSNSSSTTVCLWLQDLLLI
ncbi:peptidyl-prolyl cis-trans isomerase FKBP62-like [Canna indica]|uniref:Peptidyl-prolyl cis-trans isomerase FKBP62-like n=1 Tax=Canna indica TaxID=4628 RepID=A0AAQ3JW93_9LILI|nr:peptidyl-prolyl cis-trans isomerase FKBP62-like [Canna indica]